MLLLLLAAALIAAWAWKRGAVDGRALLAIAIALAGAGWAAKGGIVPGLMLVAAAGGLMFRRSPSAPPMPADEARLLLDLPAGADEHAIRAAHRRVVARVHPDVGGTSELARRVNAARDILLAELDRASRHAR